MLVAVAALPIAACALPVEAPIEARALSLGLAAREEPSVLHEAFDLMPESVSTTATRAVASTDVAAPAHVTYWRAAAQAYALPVRRALATWQRRLHEQDGAGLPGDLGLGAEVDDVEDLDAALVLRASVDILGILGLGPYEAAKALATAEARAAFASLDRALWSARFDVERARVRLAASRARIAVRAQLVEDCVDDSVRVAIFVERDWLARGPLAAARALIARAGQDLENERVLAAQLREVLAARAGLMADATALEAVTPVVLDEYPTTALVEAQASANATPASEQETAARLLATHPNLHALMLDYAVAEARLRRAASDAWPRLRLGAKQRLEPMNLLGSFVDFSFPWPGRVDAATRAALRARDEARFVVEEGLREIASRIETSAARLREAEAALTAARIVEGSSAAAFAAAQEMWWADTNMLGQFNDALERRIGGVVAALPARDQAFFAWLDWREAMGPDMTPVTEGGSDV